MFILKRTLVAFGVTIASLTVYAHEKECIEDRWIPLDPNPIEEPVGPCIEGDPLELSWTTHEYPDLNNNPYDVEYWKGSYFRNYSITTHFLHEAVNNCSGEVLISEKKNIVESGVKFFTLDNPNLHDNVSTSYELVPMTDDEARSAFSKLKQTCETGS